MSRYGCEPEVIAKGLDLDWPEYMHYLYLPVDMPTETPGIRLPERLEFLRRIVEGAERAERRRGNKFDYIYVTARRGYATPGNPLNRPGWHTDGFGTQDINYIWCDAYPTRFAIGDLDPGTDDHIASAEAWDRMIDDYRHRGGADNVHVMSHPSETLLRLDPYVIHSTPIIPPPGGERAFLKISFSNDCYNLRGNSHNYLFDYEWKMWDRSEIRNDPAYAGGDAGPQEVEV